MILISDITYRIRIVILIYNNIEIIIIMKIQIYFSFVEYIYRLVEYIFNDFSFRQ